MRLRLLILLLIAGLPLAAHADDSGLTAPSDASSLGPSTTDSLGPSTGSGGTSSSADSSTLQPAGTSPLQSTTNDSNGLTAPATGNPLQAPASGNQQLQVIMGDGDGPTHNVADTSTSLWTIVWWSLGIGLLVAAASLLFRRRRLRARPKTPHYDHPAPESEPESIPAAGIEPTSSQRLNVLIAKPAHEVFEFVLDPQNTPKWISFIKSETTSEWPPKLGTIYTNTDETDAEREFELTQFKPDEMFVLSKKSNTYHVRYTLTQLDEHQTELEYYEWMDEGNLAQPFTSQELTALKSAIEEPETEPDEDAADADKDQPEAKRHKHSGTHPQS